MGNVAIVMRIMPDGPGEDLEKLKSQIKDSINVESIEEEPIGFGLTALKVLVIRPDSAGGTDELENKIAEIEGVGNVEVTDVTLV